mmetsp:Transcript_90852/g.261773  ORF Transcript_90852/g.261773 Transcript_90852/m.261773 type:complete len:336 (-) Transcript_90852:385-1392(-)
MTTPPSRSLGGRQGQLHRHGLMLRPGILLRDLVVVHRVTLRPRPGDIGRDVVIPAVMLPLGPTAGPLVRHDDAWRIAADQLQPASRHLAIVDIPVAHSHGAVLHRIAADAAHDVVARVDPGVRRMDGYEAKLGATLDGRGRHHPRHREGPGAPVLAEAAAASSLHLPTLREGQGHGVPAVAPRARPVRLRPARHQRHGLAHAVGELHGRDDGGTGLARQLPEALRGSLPARLARAPGGHAALPMDIPEEGLQGKRRAHGCNSRGLRCRRLRRASVFLGNRQATDGIGRDRRRLIARLTSLRGLRPACFTRCSSLRLNNLRAGRTIWSLLLTPLLP